MKHKRRNFIPFETMALEPGMRLLDLGCGWGSLAKFAAEKYRVAAVGVTGSKWECDLARQSCAGLPVDILLQDYRNVNGTFDCVASLGLLEHLGYKNYRPFFAAVRHALKPNGLFYLGTIGAPQRPHHGDLWILKHVSPDSHIPSWEEIADGMKGFFVLENRENWARDYLKTIMAWLDNFERNCKQLRAGHDQRFERTWTYYLSALAATFHSEQCECWQILLSLA